ncbi:hypothetical protein J5N97_025025 [Dioscorea zingiberensis]|uniref:RING-type E3 ubiquitin transferase n=1 Tax=Dioscorea zingiberensis TaxID=325984 RepID=A0A9D5C878_9LILI|nr:hypothetical protein J5N97_025025 [Dioscorea zingiberensis]
MAITNHTTTTINNHTQHLSSPPPPFNYNHDPTFSPLLIVISSGVLAAFLAISCYSIISKYCLNTTNTNTNQQEQNSSTSSGLDKSIMEKIMPHSYKLSDAPIIGTECAVCLAEFSDSESLRCLPHCGHAFHIPCIDSWLKLHANCPVCRACIVSTTSVAIITNEGETSVRNSDVDIV